MHKDKIIGLVSFALGVITLIGASMIRVAKMAISMGDPGPLVFPYVAGGLLTICGIGLFFKSHAEEPVFMSRQQWMRVATLFAAFVGYVVLLYFFGFVPATPVLLFAMITMFSGEKKISILVRILYSVIVTAIIFLFFVTFLKTNIPQGILF